ncbi:hypothetical protein LGK95_10410 [Clostridium algoriphilum]|uniref:hypothetical protein n=1 Tax=Clostridium algoriphilum TaxID=198347 RepID=UPI001CF59D02|nr:hypothetical protein [Clostridium algoriphilum]MCB2293932.1 hypothetical protein [Clostridium algoriphilum]
MKKLFTIAIVLTPILFQYKSPIPGIDVATFIFMLITPFIILRSTINISLCPPLFLFLTYIMTGGLLSIGLQGAVDMLPLLRMGKFVFLIFIVIFVGYKKYFDFQFGIKVLKNATLVSSVFIIIQTVIYSFGGIRIIGIIPNLVTSDQHAMSILATSALLAGEGYYRPSSFFLEPAMFTQFCIIYLAYCIFKFDYQDDKKDVLYSILITIGIVMSTSGIGLIFVAFLWIVYALKDIKKVSNERRGEGVIFIIAIVIALFLILPQIGFIQQIVDRAFSDADGGNAVLARMIAYKYYFDLPFIFKIIGMGYGNVPSNIYFNSLAYIGYCTGVIGGIFLLWVMIYSYKRAKMFQKMLCILFTIMIFGASVFTATTICFYFPFILYQERSVTSLKLKQSVNNNYKK